MKQGEVKNIKRKKRDPFEVILPSDFWEDILKEEITDEELQNFDDAIIGWLDKIIKNKK